jgi:HlyD family secretion protein
MRGFLTLLVLIAVCAGVFALGGLRKNTDGEAIIHVAEELPLTVEVSQPKQGEIIRLVQAPGDVEAVLEVDVSSEIVSKITEMPVEEGDEVTEGDLLCRLDDKNILADLESAEARIAQLKATIVQAEADLEKAKRDLERQMRLSESDATSDLEVRDHLTVKTKAEALLKLRQFELAHAEAFHKKLQEDLKKTVITAPIDGVISKLSAKQGEVVVTGTMNNPGTVIMTISDLSRMQVRVRVDEVDIPLVQSGQAGRVYLQSDPNTAVPARVVRVASKGTKQTGRDIVTFEALMEVLSRDARVMPGMTANVEIEVARSPDAITIPVEAVVHRMRKDLPERIVEAFDSRQAGVDVSERVRQGQYIKVLYVMSDEAAEVRLVDVGIADTRYVEIVEGVGLEDAVIVGPYRSLDQLEDGKKVALAEDKKEEADKTEESEKLAESEQKNGESEEKQQGQAVAASSTP